MIEFRSGFIRNLTIDFTKEIYSFDDVHLENCRILAFNRKQLTNKKHLDNYFNNCILERCVVDYVED